MGLRANFQKNYGMRYLLLAGGCLFAAAWFAYDGLIGYPAKLAPARAYDALSELDGAEKQTQWKKIAAEKNWSTSAPDKTAKEIEDDIFGQYVWGTLALIAGLPALFFFLRTRGSWVERTETGLTTSWGQSLDYSKVTQLDKKKWAAKGIAKAWYQESGAPRRFVFDDFKYEREPLGQMLRELEAVLQPEQIVGGPPEKPPVSEVAATTEGEEAAPKSE
jgi:hypothetical protein